MDKNKNRTDLLAAGRKKLQQFRQKKDNKGSKSTTKSGKSERNDNASSTKQAATSQPVREGERSMHDADDAVASSESCSREEDSTVGNNDVATVVDQPPTSGIAETTAETTVELLSEDSRMGQANLSANVSHELPDHSSSPNQEVDNSLVVEDGISTNSKISEIADPKEQSTDSTVGNIDLATVVDQPPTSGIAETTAETTVELLTEDSRMGQANLSANVSHELPDHLSSPNQEGDNYVVVEDVISTTSKIPQIADPKEQSTDSTVGNIDVSTAINQPPASGIAETTAETIVELSSEDSRMGQANLSANVSHELPDHLSSPNQERDSSVVVEDEISTNSEVPQMADPKEQYTDSAMPLPVNISSQVEREYEERQGHCRMLRVQV